MAAEDKIKWSEETFSIQDVAYNNLPTVVKVADGYYSENEAESFSNGDLIKLDFKKSYSKVRGRCVGGKPKVDDLGYLSPDRDILIPLGYKGKVKVECVQNTFNSVEELIKHFPHFVKTGRPITGKRGLYSTEEIRIEKGVTLQLDRVIPEAGLVCKIDEKEVLLPSSQLARFYLEPDEKEYTIREVVDKFELPQYIRFLDADFEKIVTSDLTEAIDNINHFQGYLQIIGLIQQEVVVGHHKPTLVGTLKENANQRAIAILPLDSEAVRNIEVYLPVYEEDNDYEFFLARNFSKNINMDLVDGGLYLEFSKSPKIHLLNTEDEESPPPRPPPPHGKTNRRKPPTVPKTQHDIQKPSAGGPEFRHATKIKEDTKSNPSPGPNKKKPPPPIKVKPKKVSSRKEKTDREQDSDDEDAGDYEEMSVLTPPPVTKPFSRIQPIARKQPPIPLSSLPVLEDDSEDDEPESAYEEIPDILEVEEYSKKTGLDFSKFPKTFRVGLKKVHNELKKLKRSHSVEVKSPPSSQDLNVPPSIDDLSLRDSDDSDEEESLAYDYPDLTKLASMPRPPPVSDTPRYQASLRVTKPVGKIQPISREENPTKKFSDMTTEEVVSLFKMTKLPSLATMCEKEGLDGSFFSSLSETELKNAFKLSDLQFIKVNKIINEGWRPHVN
ncbi:uncharacterized protein LOC133199561 isoform X2 [Saccostrea echinata]|uniref:uncharacterized protein LOC133199561 isoform X2 n=1 Tax=Saccostrea echinata TaxID=191078 RepID=UPI002A808E14|nr:uncharacterized protein LOC133199561 isoform X2 [Saccostrea echinata]